MKTIRIGDATASLADCVREFGRKPLIVTRRGRPVTALVPVDGMDLESLSVSTNPQFIDLIERSRCQYAKEGGISADELRRQLGVGPRAGKARRPARTKPTKP